MKKVLGDGEAVSLAVAHHRGWAFVTYEKGRTEREPRHLLAAEQYLRTPRLLAMAIQAGMIETEQLEAEAGRAAGYAVPGREG